MNTLPIIDSNHIKLAHEKCNNYEFTGITKLSENNIISFVFLKIYENTNIEMVMSPLMLEEIKVLKENILNGNKIQEIKFRENDLINIMFYDIKANKYSGTYKKYYILDCIANTRNFLKLIKTRYITLSDKCNNNVFYCPHSCYDETSAVDKYIQEHIQELNNQEIIKNLEDILNIYNIIFKFIFNFYELI
jgi:hypothetical protein